MFPPTTQTLLRRWRGHGGAAQGKHGSGQGTAACPCGPEGRAVPTAEGAAAAAASAGARGGAHQAEVLS